MDAILLLEDGRTFGGRAFGARTTRVGEIVFNTSMTGYQEALTDPSYAEQILVMTASHLGNTGMNGEDVESDRIWASGFVVRDLTEVPSNWRATGSLSAGLAAEGVPGLAGIDTRALVRHLRDRGAMRCVISTDGSSVEALRARLEAWPGMVGRDLASEASCKAPWVLAAPARPSVRLAVLDGGAKRNILRLLEQAGAAITVFPLHTPASELARGADGVLLTNGPGDPAALVDVVGELRSLVGRVPLVGICLGHQLLALALGATTYKLPFGHRGANQPVRDERTGKIQITSQNHGFAVDRESLLRAGARITHTHLNDHTVSGFDHVAKRVYAVQYHPEASPGPHDGAPILLQEFISFVRGDT